MFVQEGGNSKLSGTGRTFAYKCFPNRVCVCVCVCVCRVHLQVSMNACVYLYLLDPEQCSVMSVTVSVTVHAV